MSDFLSPTTVGYVNAVVISGKVTEFIQDGPNLRTGYITIQTIKGEQIRCFIKNDTEIEGHLCEFVEGIIYGYLESYGTYNGSSFEKKLAIVATRFVQSEYKIEEIDMNNLLTEFTEQSTK